MNNFEPVVLPDEVPTLVSKQLNRRLANPLDSSRQIAKPEHPTFLNRKPSMDFGRNDFPEKDPPQSQVLERIRRNKALAKLSVS